MPFHLKNPMPSLFVSFFLTCLYMPLPSKIPHACPFPFLSYMLTNSSYASNSFHALALTHLMPLLSINTNQSPKSYTLPLLGDHLLSLLFLLHASFSLLRPKIQQAYFLFHLSNHSTLSPLLLHKTSPFTLEPFFKLLEECP